MRNILDAMLSHKHNSYVYPFHYLGKLDDDGFI